MGQPDIFVIALRVAEVASAFVSAVSLFAIAWYLYFKRKNGNGPWDK
jgi:hypothetical protein